jgi:hypothetical protein
MVQKMELRKVVNLDSWLVLMMVGMLVVQLVEVMVVHLVLLLADMMDVMKVC